MQSEPERAMAMQIESVTSLDALEAHADQWDRLASSAPEQVPMLAHACVAAYLEARNTGGWPWRCLLAYRAGQLVGVLPLIRSRGLVRPRLVGTGDAHSILGHPLIAAERPEETFSALVRKMWEIEPRLWMRFSRVRTNSPFLQALPPLEKDLRVFSRTNRRGAWLDTSGSFEDYQAELSKNFKGNVRSARNRARRDFGLEFECIPGTDAADPSLLREFLRVEASGWKAMEGTAIASDPDRAAYYTAVARYLARRGWLEWNLARFGGSVVAIDFAVRFGRSRVLWKIAYDESYAKYKPGVILMNEVIARSFADESIDELNLLSDQPWMHVWHPEYDDYEDVIVSPRYPVATLSAMVEAAAIPRRIYDGYIKDRPELRRRARTVARKIGVGESPVDKRGFLR